MDGGEVSSVTSLWLIEPVHNTETGAPEKRIKETAKFVHDFIHNARGFTFSDEGTYQTIDLLRDDWSTLQSGGKVAGMAGMWFGWNYAQPGDLLEALKDFEPAKGAVLVWQHEDGECISVGMI
jgi:hypothetical protein